MAATASSDLQSGIVDLKQIVADMEALVLHLAGFSDPQIAAVRENLEDALKRLRASALDQAHSAIDRARYAAQATDAAVRGSPWAAAGVAVLAGVALGASLARR